MITFEKPYVSIKGSFGEMRLWTQEVVDSLVEEILFPDEDNFISLDDLEEELMQ